MPTSRAISRQSLPETIVRDLRERILSGEMGEGEPIRQEALADEYGVSRMPIREALKRLDAEGLVLLTNNRGATVVKHSLSEIGEIFDLRALLEVDLFRRSIPNMSADIFASCDTLLHKMEQSFDADDVAQWGTLNHQYHTALYSAADRRLTHDILQRVSLLSDRYVRLHLSVMEQRAPAKEDHEQLLELAKRGEIDEACALLNTHVLRTRDQLLDMVISKRGAEGA